MSRTKTKRPQEQGRGTTTTTEKESGLREITAASYLFPCLSFLLSCNCEGNKEEEEHRNEEVVWLSKCA